MEKIAQAQELHSQGQSLRQIAQTLGTSKSSVQRWLKEEAVEKSWLSPRWTTLQGADPKPVDSYGAVPAPEVSDLLDCYEDTTYSCVKWLSDTESSIPWRIYVKTLPGQAQPKCVTSKSLHPLIKKNMNLEHLGNVDVKEVLKHPYKDILDHPNPHMHRDDMIRIISIDLRLAGNAFLYKRRENHEDREEQDLNEGLVEQLWAMSPAKIEMACNNTGHFIGWYDKRFNSPKFIPKEDMVWFKFVDPRSPYGLGMGPTRGVYERILLGKAELAYLSALYRNQARPDSIITIKDISPDEAARYQKEYNQRYRQGGMGGPWVVNGEDIDAKPLNWNPKDILGSELYQWTKLQILNAFLLNEGVFTTEAVSWASADVARYMAYRNAVLPTLRLIEEVFDSQLAPEFDERLIVVFDNPCPDDKQSILDEQVKLMGSGVLLPEEVREMRGLPPLEEEQEAPKEENALRASVGGSQALLQLQQAVYSSPPTLPREAAISNAMLLFGFNEEEAGSLFPKVEPNPAPPG